MEYQQCAYCKSDNVRMPQVKINAGGYGCSNCKNYADAIRDKQELAEEHARLK